MLDSIPYRQFREWQEFAALIGPLGIQRTDWQCARMLALTYNQGRGKNQRGMDAREFMPDWHPISYVERMKRSMAKMKAWAFQRSPEVRKMRKQGKRKKGDKS